MNLREVVNTFFREIVPRVGLAKGHGNKVGEMLLVFRLVSAFEEEVDLWITKKGLHESISHNIDSLLHNWIYCFEERCHTLLQ